MNKKICMSKKISCQLGAVELVKVLFVRIYHGGAGEIKIFR